jgi:hypothetical protein
VPLSRPTVVESGARLFATIDVELAVTTATLNAMVIASDTPSKSRPRAADPRLMAEPPHR